MDFCVKTSGFPCEMHGNTSRNNGGVNCNESFLLLELCVILSLLIPIVGGIWYDSKSKVERKTEILYGMAHFYDDITGCDGHYPFYRR